jgi:peptide/nickel transport system permease protein
VIRIAAVVLMGGLLGATLVRIAPGFGVDQQELDTRLNRQSIDALRQSHAVNQNIGAFYLGYFSHILRGDLGFSESLQKPVAELLRERFPETLKAVGLGVLFGWTLGFSLALSVVLSRTWYLDLLAGVLAGTVLCLPVAFVALLFVVFQAPARLLLGLVIFPKVYRYCRNLLARSAAAPHIITAKAKGAGTFRLLAWHILPTVASQLFALAAVCVSVAFTAAIPVEALCDIPGIGQLAWKAALGRDFALLINLTMIVTLITVTTNAVSDLIGQRLGGSATCA